MTRQECEEMVKGPGKFEAEPVYAPYYWDLAMISGEDETECDGDTLISVFNVSDEDRAIFPELNDVKTIRLWEDGNGFVWTEAI